MEGIKRQRARKTTRPAERTCLTYMCERSLYMKKMNKQLGIKGNSENMEGRTPNLKGADTLYTFSLMTPWSKCHSKK
jgi:hypothetical protein